MQIEKVQTGGIPYLNKKIVNDGGVKVVTIKTVPELVDTEYEGKKSQKLQCTCDTGLLDPVSVLWQMNATTQNFLIDLFGKETEKWVGKEVQLAVKQAGSASAAVYPKDCSLEKVIS